MIEAKGKTVLPGLYDSHVHPVGAALSEAGSPLPCSVRYRRCWNTSRRRRRQTPEGKWIIIQYAFPTRLKEARFPTRAELDEAAPKHPVLYHAGPAGIANSMGLKVSGITRDTKDPPAGQVVKDPTSGEPTGMLRNAYGVLKGVPEVGEMVSSEKKREAVKKLIALYNQNGLTSIADRNATRADLDLYLSLQKENGADDKDQCDGVRHGRQSR